MLDLRTGFVVGIFARFSEMESTVDRMEGSKKSDTCFLCVNSGVSINVRGTETGGLPCQHQLSHLDPMFGIVVPWRTKFDVLRSAVVRKYSF